MWGRGQGGRRQRRPRDGDPYVMEDREVGGRGLRGMGALSGMEGSRTVLQHLCGGLGTGCPDGVSNLNWRKHKPPIFTPFLASAKPAPPSQPGLAASSSAGARRRAMPSWVRGRGDAGGSRCGAPQAKPQAPAGRPQGQQRPFQPQPVLPLSPPLGLAAPERAQGQRPEWPPQPRRPASGALGCT